MKVRNRIIKTANGTSFMEDDQTVGDRIDCLLRTACLRKPVGAVSASDEGRALAMDIVDEVVSVALKKRIEVEAERIKATLNMALADK